MAFEGIGDYKDDLSTSVSNLQKTRSDLQDFASKDPSDAVMVLLNDQQALEDKVQRLSSQEEIEQFNQEVANHVSMTASLMQQGPRVQQAESTAVVPVNVSVPLSYSEGGPMQGPSLPPTGSQEKTGMNWTMIGLGLAGAAAAYYLFKKSKKGSIVKEISEPAAA